MQYNIFQVKDQSEQAREAGHHMFFGSKHFNPENFGFFQKVCEVDGRCCGLASGDMDYTVKSKDEVFAILNGSYHDEDTDTDNVFEAHVSGYTYKEGTSSRGVPYKVRNMHSLSVGDIIAEVPQVGYEVMDPSDIVKHTTYHMVDSYGFTDITDLLTDLDIAKVRLETA